MGTYNPPCHNAHTLAAMNTCKQLWQHFVSHAIDLSINIDIVIASYPSAIEESQAFAACVSKMGTFQADDVTALISSIRPGTRIQLIDPIPSKVKQILKVVDDTNQVIVVMSSPIGYPQDLVFYEVRKKYELANQFLVELSHFRSCDDVVPSPVPSQSGRQSHAAFPTWALIRKPTEPVSAHPTYVDVINNEWVISFSAIVGFHERNALDQWMQLGFDITKDKTFFRKQNDEKMYAVSVSINVALINSNTVCGACGIIRNYLAKALGAQYKGIFPYFQIFVGQLPASCLLTARILRFLSLIPSVVALEYIGHRHISSECLQKLPAIMFGLPSSGNSWCYELHPFNIKRLSMP